MKSICLPMLKAVTFISRVRRFVIYCSSPTPRLQLVHRRIILGLCNWLVGHLGDSSPSRHKGADTEVSPTRLPLTLFVTQGTFASTAFAAQGSSCRCLTTVPAMLPTAYLFHKPTSTPTDTSIGNPSERVHPRNGMGKQKHFFGLEILDSLHKICSVI